MSGLMKPDSGPVRALTSRGTKRRLDAALAVDEYAHDRALELARHKLRNIDMFSATRLQQGAALAMFAAEAVAMCPEAQLGVANALIDRESAASGLLWDLTR